jgi:hypothetical protein
MIIKFDGIRAMDTIPPSPIPGKERTRGHDGGWTPGCPISLVSQYTRKNFSCGAFSTGQWDLQMGRTRGGMVNKE